MIELKKDTLVVSFPEVHRDAVMRIDFQRTLRIPDDDRTYPLPPGLGRFPLRHVDDFAERVPEEWLSHGGVMLPMYQSEAMWLRFSADHGYPFAVKVGTGKINAVTGEPWRDGLHTSPQDYLVLPHQPWLDGYCVEKGVIRQFVAMPLGSGYSAEEQITGAGEHGGIQIEVYPIDAKLYERVVPRVDMLAGSTSAVLSAIGRTTPRAMGLAPGGRMKQKIYDDHYPFEEWDQGHRSRCFVHLANSLVWRSITGMEAPPTPVTAKEYTRAGLPWFAYYAADQKAVKGAPILAKLKSVWQMGEEKGDKPLPENESVDPAKVIPLRAGLRPDEVREGSF